jgi:DNA polymerase III subunit chi
VTRVDFYILPDVDLEARRRFACRLAHKAVAMRQRVYVLVTDAAAGADLDALMWEYPAHHFLPHGIAGEPASVNAPVVIDHQEPVGGPVGDTIGKDGNDQLLINLSAAIPPFFSRFERVAEIIVENLREDGRDRYKLYRDRGYPLFHHDIEQWDET